MKWSEAKVARETNLPLYVQLANVIRELITSGKLQPMEQIPVSREMQGMFHLSPATVERGITCLVKEGYLLRRPRIGTFVAADPPATPPKPKPKPKTKSRGIVKLVFSKIQPYGNYWFQTLFLFEHELRERHAVMQFMIHDEGKPLNAQELADDCLGVIFCGVNPLSLVMELHALQVPLVIVGSLDHYHSAVKQMDQITGNDVTRYALGMRHLLLLGHRRILALTAQAGSQFTRRQQAGYRQALGEFGLEETDIDYLALPDAASDTQPWEEMIKKKLCSAPFPTAISVYSGFAACITLRAIVRLGLAVPEDISIITYDSWYAELTVPTLTVVYSESNQNSIAVERLFRQLDDPTHQPGPCIIGGDSQVRLNESSRFYTEKLNRERSVLS